MQGTTALLAGFGLALASPGAAVRLSDINDKARHTTALTIQAHDRSVKKKLCAAVNAHTDSRHLATEYENSTTIELPEAMFDLPSDADARFRRFLRAYHVKAVSNTTAASADAGSAPAQVAAPTPVVPDAEVVPTREEKRKAAGEKRKTDLRACTPRWMLMSTVVHYY